MPDWTEKPIAELAAALRGGSLTSRELTEAAIDRHRRFGEKLHAYKAWNPDLARRQAASADAAFARGQDLGPLQGIPISIKDIYGVRGYPVFAGSPQRLPEPWERPGPVVAALTRQHGVVMGKTHTVEFAYGGLGLNAHWGTPVNPWDARDHRAPGGSSAGAGVSLAEGSALVALGTDTGGSVRVPASLTGSVGLKTTFGRWPTEGIVPLSLSLDTAGLLTRTVADAALAFRAVEAGLPGRTARALTARPVKNLTLALTENYFWDRCDDSIARVVRGAITELKAAGAAFHHNALPEAAVAPDVLAEGAVVAAEGYAHLSAELPDWIATLDPYVRERMEDGRRGSAVAYLKALARMRRLQTSASARLLACDALLVPTVRVTPPRLADIRDWDSYRIANTAVLSNVNVVNILGLCALTLPVGLDDHGMPVGLQLIAAAGRDEALLETALAVEAALGTARERIGLPPLTRT